MRLLKSFSQAILLISLLLLMPGANALAQERPNASRRSAAPPAKTLPVKTDPQEAQKADAKDRSLSGSLGEREDDSDQIRQRAEWFYQQRSTPDGRIPAGARLKAFQHMQRMMVAEGKLALLRDGTYAAATPQVGAAVGGKWSPLGPTSTTGGFFSPVSGRIEAIAVDPSDTTGNTVLVGGAMGGIWRSTDAGSTWTPVGDQNASLAMGSIAFAPSNPSIAYAGTGEQAAIGFDTYYGAGVLVSTDHGQTWKQTCNAPNSTCPFIGPFNGEFNLLQ